MGLFDNTTDGQMDPQNAALIAMGLQLISPKQYKTSFLGDVGQAGLFGMQTLGSVKQQNLALQKAAREDQAAQLSQVVQTYKILKDQDQQARINAAFDPSQPYTGPSPLLAAHEQKLAALLGMPSPASGAAPASPFGSPQGGGAPAAPTLPAAQASQYSMAVRPELRPDGPMPQPPAPAPQPQMSLGQLAQGAGIPPALAASMAQTPTGLNELAKTLAKTYGPQVVNNVLMQLQPGGGTKFLGGAVGSDVVPVTVGPDGKPQLAPIPGATEYFAQRAGATETAKRTASAPFDFSTYKTGPGGADQVMSIAKLFRLENPGGVNPMSIQMPGAPQPAPAPSGPAPQGVARLDVTAPPAPGNGAAFRGGGGLTAPNPVDVAAAMAQAQGLAQGGVTYKNNLDSTVQTGNDLMLRLSESRDALQNFKPGMGAEVRLNAARLADALGAPQSLVDKINAGDVSAKQEFMKLSAQQAMESLKQAMGGAGRISQAEFKVFQQNNPNIELDPRAIEKIFDFTQRTHTRNVAEQQALSDYLDKGGNISSWPARWSQLSGGGMAPKGAPKIGEKRGGYAYIGGDPASPASWKRAP